MGEPRLRSIHVRALIGGLLAAAIIAAVVANVKGSSSATPPPDPLANGMINRLFPANDLQIVAAPIAQAEARGRKAANRYLATHPAPDRAAFLNFAIQSVGPPPGPGVTRQEIAQLHRIAAHRTKASAAAALWLESEGKKHIWTRIYMHQYRDQVPTTQGERARALLKRTLALADTLTTLAKSHYNRTSPYQVDPTLRGLNQKRFSGARKVSYPSKHSVISAAAVTVLTHYEPPRAGEYRWMDDQIGYSRLLGGGHYLSDLTAGAYLGAMLGEYELAFPAPAT